MTAFPKMSDLSVYLSSTTIENFGKTYLDFNTQRNGHHLCYNLDVKARCYSYFSSIASTICDCCLVLIYYLIITPISSMYFIIIIIIIIITHIIFVYNIKYLYILRFSYLFRLYLPFWFSVPFPSCLCLSSFFLSFSVLIIIILSLYDIHSLISPLLNPPLRLYEYIHEYNATYYSEYIDRHIQVILFIYFTLFRYKIQFIVILFI